MADPKTCLDFGFITIKGYELTHPQRIMLSTHGKSAVMPQYPEKTRCFKNLWEYDLDYAGDAFEGVVYELKLNRTDCKGFMEYEAGFNPEQHLEIQIDRRKEQLHWRIALLGFAGALLGGVLGVIFLRLFDWLTTK